MLLNDDCLEAMQKLIDDGVQVDSIVTDPPYHLQSIVDRFKNTSPEDDTYTSEKVRNRSDGYSRLVATGFMGQEWDGGDIAFRKETWELALKLLKPGGHILAFSASRNYHRMAVAIEDAGFEIRDQLMWLYGSGFPKSHNLGDGWGTALKPAHEPIVMGKKRLEGTNKQNKEKYGTGGINIDGCRVEFSDNDDPRVDKEYFHNASPDFKPGLDKENSIGEKQKLHDDKGRFPANVMHDRLQDDWARYFYSPKVSKSERGEDNTHPTVKPQELMKYLCRLVTPKGGIVLDPFMGSGSTGMAAKDEGFEFIGIEREKKYFEIAEKRIQAASPLMEFI
jgi:site-specific DNA-methyltransferase (adenine-specific)